VPRSIQIILLGDNIDSCKPGDEIEVTGIYLHRFDYLLNIKHGFPIFSTILESNMIRRSDEIFNTNLPDEDK
jgi:DNA replication licensing factor MCM2